MPLLDQPAAPVRVDIDVVRTQALGCVRCPLSRSRTQVVWADGNLDSDVAFIGEAPGFHEDKQGRPFVGAAGQFLNELLASVGLRRDAVFIANVVKHRPPENRDPLPDEIAACAGYLDRQIALVDPRVIVTLGRHSLGRFFPGEKISRIHGVARRHGPRLILPLYHPAAALHQASLRRTVEEDFRRLPQVIAEAEKLVAPPAPPAGRPEPPPDPKQLSLF